jgi:uncharacterized RDD family membrane protein YckC
LVEIVALVINLIYGIQTYMHATSNYGGTADYDPTGYVLVGTASSGLLMFGYFVVFELLRGRTFGKRLFGLRVHGPAGAPKPNLKQTAIRNSFCLLVIVPYIGWLLVLAASIFIAVTINSSPTKQGKHDELAGGTQVVKV